MCTIGILATWAGSLSELFVWVPGPVSLRFLHHAVHTLFAHCVMSWGVANSENWDLNNSFSAFFSFYLVRPSSYYLCCSWHPHHSTCTTMCITSGRNTTRVEPENIWLGNRFVNFYAPWQGHPLQEIGSKLGYTRRDLFCICVHGHWLSTDCTTGAKKTALPRV